MNDRAVTGWHKVNDLAHRGRVLITGHHQRAWRDPGRVASLIQERPQVSGLVLVIEVRGDVRGLFAAAVSS
jgi:hypothetical protein